MTKFMVNCLETLLSPTLTSVGRPNLSISRGSLSTCGVLSRLLLSVMSFIGLMRGVTAQDSAGRV